MFSWTRVDQQILVKVYVYLTDAPTHTTPNGPNRVDLPSDIIFRVGPLATFLINDI